jgi:hypothetical protein
MSLAVAIILGIIAITAIAVGGDVVSTSIKSRAKAREASSPPEIDALRDRLRALESRLDERDQAFRKLEDELRFVSRMLEDKSGRP